MTVESDRPPSESAEKCTTRCEFRSPVLHFRPVEISDLELMFRWRSDQRQSRFLLAPAPRDLAEQTRWFQKVKDDPASVYYMTYNASHLEQPFGYTSITRIDHAASEAEFGVTIGSPENVGKGQSFYLGGSLLTIAFRQFGLTKLYSSCHPENELGNRAVARLGGELMEGPCRYRKGDECLRIHTPDSFAESIRLEQERFPQAGQAFDLRCTNAAHHFRFGSDR